MSIQPTAWVLNQNQTCPTSPHLHYNSPDYDIIEIFVHAMNKFIQSMKEVNNNNTIASMIYLFEIQDRKFQRKQ
jgi:hypothetical protein